MGHPVGIKELLSVWEPTPQHTYGLDRGTRIILAGLPRWFISKNLPANAGDMGPISGLGRSPGEGNGNPLQYILVWEIPWTEEPGGLHFMES